MIGFTSVTENNNFYHEIDRIDFLAHYIYFDNQNNNLMETMRLTSKFWHEDIHSIHFFLDALKGNFITSTNFIKLVFTIESFYGNKSSNDFISLTLPLILGKNINEMKAIKEITTTSFNLRNNIVHGNENYNLRKYINKTNSKSLAKLFFELKNLIIKIFIFFITEKLYHNKHNEKINHELIFKFLPKGISK